MPIRLPLGQKCCRKAWRILSIQDRQRTMTITAIARMIFATRRRALAKHYTAPLELQEQALGRLLRHARHTAYGKGYGLHGERYADLVRCLPVTDYDGLKDYIDRMRHGEKDVLWTGQVKWYAKSSGTTNDKSKFIPVSAEGLQGMHYRGGFDAVTMYLNNHPESRLLDGKGLILGGSHSPNYNVAGSLVGDLSAILIENIHPLARMVRLPRKETALLADFEEKRDRIARECATKNVTSISGVPSWMLSVLVRVLEHTGKKDITEVWPNLEVFFHGGIAFTPYREQYKQLIPTDKMHYMETYNASEGFFGLQDDPADSSMLLMLDYDVFYEFIPMEDFESDTPRIVPLEGVQTGINYAMMISTSCGLWRYVIGDTIRFTSIKPYKFVITGRTKYFINAFGEEVIMDNAEKALAYACAHTGAQILDYTAAPVYMDSKARCRHQWMIEFGKAPDDMEEFAELLDRHLQEINSDYEAKRSNDITLQRLEVMVARKGLFDEWLKSKNKLGGQHKVPRLSNSRKVLDELIAMNASV